MYADCTQLYRSFNSMNQEFVAHEEDIQTVAHDSSNVAFYLRFLLVFNKLEQVSHKL